MAYVSQDLKKKIVSALKPIMKKYGMNATYSVHHHSSFCVNLKSGVIDFGKTEGQVNVYWVDDNYSGVAREFLKEVLNTIKVAGAWYNNSNAMIDYFDTAFYIDINIGKWDKPYQLLENAQKDNETVKIAKKHGGWEEKGKMYFPTVDATQSFLEEVLDEFQKYEKAGLL